MNADEREVLLDFKRRHTITCLPTRFRKEAPAALESLRCGLLGDSFSCGVVAFLMQHLLHAHGFMPRLLTVAGMRAPATLERVHQWTPHELELRLAQSHIVQADPCGSDVRVDSRQVADMKSWPRRPIDVARWK